MGPLDRESTRAAGFDRLLRAVAEPPAAYAPFFDRLIDLWGVDEAEVLRVLERSRDPRGWRRGPVPGGRVIGVRAGAKTSGASVCLARFVPGFRFPKHRHAGPEAVLVLRGGYTDSSGCVLRPGDFQQMAADSEHALEVHEGEPCVVGVRQEGMEFTGPVMRLLVKAFGRS
jgi:anti-sigma factor ChrR (cupin superfamily)